MTVGVLVFLRRRFVGFDGLRVAGGAIVEDEEASFDWLRVGGMIDMRKICASRIVSKSRLLFDWKGQKICFDADLMLSSVALCMLSVLISILRSGLARDVTLNLC